MRKLPFQVFIEPVIHRSNEEALRFAGQETDLRSLCKQAGIPLRATVPRRKILVVYGKKQIKTPKFDIVGVPVRDLDSPEAALRALEALAYSFFDHGARACVCHRGLFTTPS